MKVVGNEGTLGVIMAASLRLFDRPQGFATAMLCVKDVPAAMAVLREVQAKSGNAVECFELIQRIAYDMVKKHMPQFRMPFEESPELGFLIEIAALTEKNSHVGSSGQTGVDEFLEDLISSNLEANFVENVMFAKSKVDRTNLWALRERTLEPTDHEGTWLRADVSLPQKLLAKLSDVSTHWTDLRI